MTSAEVISEMRQANLSIGWPDCHVVERRGGGGEGGGGPLLGLNGYVTLYFHSLLPIANQKGCDDPLTSSDPSHYHMQWCFPIVTP